MITDTENTNSCRQADVLGFSCHAQSTRRGDERHANNSQRLGVAIWMFNRDVMKLWATIGTDKSIAVDTNRFVEYPAATQQRSHDFTTVITSQSLKKLKQGRHHNRLREYV
jgi:hypothetical protein